MKTFGDSANAFFSNLKPTFTLPGKIEFLLPYNNQQAKELTKKFFNKFYSDTNKRTFIIGINPGRFGAGTTGIAFTDPIKLESECGIRNTIQKKPELSSEFVYSVIKNFGGVDLFYSKFFLTAVCPIGFTKEGININYYDDKKLQENCSDFIKSTMKKQFSFGAFENTAVCLGEGKNYKYLSQLNSELKLFKEIIPLSHPRYIMQYKRKKLAEFYDKYIDILTTAHEKNSKI